MYRDELVLQAISKAKSSYLCAIAGIGQFGHAQSILLAVVARTSAVAWRGKLFHCTITLTHSSYVFPDGSCARAIRSVYLCDSGESLVISLVLWMHAELKFTQRNSRKHLALPTL